MDILIKNHPNRGSHVVLLFGLGMIGSAIRDALRRLEYQAAHQIPMDWADAERLERAFEAIRRTCLGLVSSPARISIAWSAGKANFFSTDQEVDDENQSFEATLKLTEALADSLGNTRLEFHYLSSAGGLFEGQRVVNKASRAVPQRPYGRMKHEQERKVLESAGQEISIYRPSSVYGPMVRPRKHGLINHLIANASKRRTTVLDANVMALRDYVYAGDIGEFVARKIAFPGESELSVPVHFLVSGRCASIFEVVTRIERVLKLRVRFRFDMQFGNSANITFSDSVIPAGWRPSTLDVGIRQFVLKDQPQTRSISAAPISTH